MKGALGIGCLSLKRLTAKGLEGGLLYRGPWVMKGRLWGQASLFMGTLLVNLEWACLPGTLRDGEGGCGVGAYLCMGALHRELVRRDPLLGNLEDR
jgi:hypothetical protein